MFLQPSAIGLSSSVASSTTRTPLCHAAYASSHSGRVVVNPPPSHVLISPQSSSTGSIVISPAAKNAPASVVISPAGIKSPTSIVISPPQASVVGSPACTASPAVSVVHPTTRVVNSSASVVHSSTTSISSISVVVTTSSVGPPVFSSASLAILQSAMFLLVSVLLPLLLRVSISMTLAAIFS